MDIYVANIEQGMPSLEQAKIRFDQALRSARTQRCKAIKVIHGYGSSGKGGLIRREVHRALAEQKRIGKVKAFSHGEEFSPFYSDARALVDNCPALARDRDYAAANHGVTFVLL